VVRTIAYRSDQPLRSLAEACDFWMTYMGLRDAASRRILRDFLAARLRRDGRGWIAPYRKRAAVVTWRRRTGGERGGARGGNART
jgi:hypothetical protein